MPKQKTHKGAAKRYKVTGTGKIRHAKAWRGHNRHSKYLLKSFDIYGYAGVHRFIPQVEGDDDRDGPEPSPALKPETPPEPPQTDAASDEPHELSTVQLPEALGLRSTTKPVSSLELSAQVSCTSP